MARHREAQQHASLGVVDRDVDASQTRFIFEQRHLDLASKFVRRRRQVPVNLRQIGETIVRQMHESVAATIQNRSEEHTSELQSRRDLVCRLLLEKKKQQINTLKGMTD